MYTSTRKKQSVTASKAIIDGLAPKGGLYVFESIKHDFFHERLMGLSYKELTKEVFHLFLDDYSEQDINEMIDKAYSDQFFKPDMVMFKEFDHFAFLELFHGPTFAFKDMALSILPHMFDYAKKIQKIDKKTMILTATSGDTGSATLSGFKEVEDTYVIVLYPKNGVSKFQDLQMHQKANENCKLIPINGNFDDCQNIVKSIFETEKPEHAVLSSANSINIGRIIPQVVYYIYSYLHLCETNTIQFGELLNVSVPTGNFGNIYAASVAKRLGVPIKQLIIASNTNKVLTDLFHDHQYDIKRAFHKTMSPSMDILVSSNFERYLYDLTKDTKKVEEYMLSLKKEKHIEIKELENQTDFYATYASEEETKVAINRVYQMHDYLVDPHTAVAYSAYQKYVDETKDDTYTLIVSTASPFKFSDAMMKSLHKDQTDSLKEDMKNLKSLDKELYDERIDDVLQSSINASSIDLDQAEEFVKKVIGDIDVKD